jgi:hypothetical protein
MQEVQACDNWPSWKEVMDRRISSLEQARTWTTVPHPTRKNVVGCKCVFILKRKVDRSIDKYKACLVTRGFTQIYSINYYDTYSPVAHLASFHLILAIAAQNNWEVEAFDFNSAYLNGELNTDEEIYMQEPLGYKTVTEDGVKKLLKALYGLKQAGVTIRNHAYQKLFPFIVTRPSSLLPLPSTRIRDRYVIKLHIPKLFPFPCIVRYDVKLHLPGLGPDARYGAKLQPRTSRSPRQYQ